MLHRLPPPTVELTAYERQRAGNIARNRSVLKGLGLFSPPGMSAQKRTYTKTADKVMPRKPPGRITKKPTRLFDEIAHECVEDDVFALADQIGVHKNLKEYDDTECYIPCSLCNRLLHFSYAGITEFDEHESMFRSYTCPDCENTKELNSKRDKKTVPLPPVLAMRKLSSTILPMAYTVRKDLTTDVSDCVKAANQHTQSRLRFDEDDYIHSIMKLGATQVVCIDSECDGTIATLGGGTMTPRGQKYRYQCRLCGNEWQQFPPDKCPDRNFEITTKKYNKKPGAKNKRKNEVNFCKRCKVPKKRHKCGQSPASPLPPLPMPMHYPEDDLDALLAD